ncbi:MAG TPA: glycerol-3-phosphate 1-O-acyltransferase PlsY [Bryobacteraceae bacterium]
MTLIWISTLLAYFLGGLPFGYWFVRLSSGQDIRTMGSGNIGATNVHRTAGKKAGLIVLFLDILKGFLAVWIASLLTHGNVLALALAAAAAMLGHCYPLLLRFKGGKAVACFIGAFAFITPLPLLATTLVFVAVVALSKYISLGSILGALVFPLLVWLLQRPPRDILLASIFAAALIIYRHQGNISRLRRGKEPTFSLKGKAA